MAAEETSVAPWRGPSRARVRESFSRGRSASTLEDTAADIRSNGGFADLAMVDTLDERRVNAFGDHVAAQVAALAAAT
jgi:hypothetical protein